MKFKIVMALAILFMISSPAYSDQPIPNYCPLSGLLLNKGVIGLNCKILQGDELFVFCADHNSSIEILMYCLSRENLRRVDINTNFELKINETVHINSKNTTIRLASINNTGVKIHVLYKSTYLETYEFRIGEKKYMVNFYLTLREIGEEPECLNCDRICPTLCVKLWELRKKDKFSEKECVFNECGSGCGPDGVNSFNSEEECKLALHEQISNADTAVFYIEDIPKNPNVTEAEETMPSSEKGKWVPFSGINFYLIGGVFIFLLIIVLIIKINWK